MAKTFRLDRDGTHRGMFDKNKKKIYATQTVCEICGSAVDILRQNEQSDTFFDSAILSALKERYQEMTTFGIHLLWEISNNKKYLIGNMADMII